MIDWMKIFIVWLVVQFIIFCVTAGIWLPKLTTSLPKTPEVIASITLQSLAIAILFLSCGWFLKLHGINVIRWFEYICIFFSIAMTFSAIGVQFAIFTLLQQNNAMGLPLVNLLIPIGITGILFAGFRTKFDK